jgi:TatD DNase family protein
MHFIDTHTHLYLSDFRDDIDKVIGRAIDNGVTKMLLPNIDSKTIKNMNDLAARYKDNVYQMMAVHPGSIKEDFKQELKIVEDELARGHYIAVGETGIDLYREKKYIKEQLFAFERQLELAVEFNLPVVIHARNSFSEIFTSLDKFKNSGLKGVFHAFTGNVDQARHIINSFNFKLGIGGIVTFKNSGLDRVISEIDLAHIVLETDSPFLAPVPFRGKRNESGYLVYIAGKVAEIKNISQLKVAEVTTRNATDIFGI